MNETLKNAVKRFAVACHVAKDNPKLLIACGNGASELCGKRMEELHKAEGELLEILKNTNDKVPIVVNNWLGATKDPGCSSCWASSVKSRVHPECQKKIDRYFEVRGKLIEYGLTLE